MNLRKFHLYHPTWLFMLFSNFAPGDNLGPELWTCLCFYIVARQTFYCGIPITGISINGIPIKTYIHILDARERAKARSLLDPSDAKAFSPPMTDLEILLASFDCSPLPSALRFPNWDFRIQRLDLNSQPSAHSPSCALTYRRRKIFQISCVGTAAGRWAGA